jgi:hypothetical protein
MVAEALGSTAKPHSIYCRFDTLKKKATAAFGPVPNLDDLIKDAIEEGTINSKALKGPKVAAKKGKKTMDDDEDDGSAAETLKSKGRKRAAPAAKGRGKKAKVTVGDDEDLLGYNIKQEIDQEEEEEEV